MRSEDDPVADISSLSPYDIAKRKAEAILLGAAAQGADIVVTNPGLLIGPGRTGCKPPPGFVASWAATGKMPVLVDSMSTFADVRDVAAGMVSALTNGLSGQRYILGGTTMWRSQYYRLLAEFTQTKSPRTIPLWVLKAVSICGDVAAAITHQWIPSPIDRRFARSQALHYCGESKKAISELNYSCRAVETTVLDMLMAELQASHLPESLQFIERLDPGSYRRDLMIRQLVTDHQWLPRESCWEIAQICQANRGLSAVVEDLKLNGVYDVRRGRYRWTKESADYLRQINQLLDHVYFSSEPFLRSVM